MIGRLPRLLPLISLLLLPALLGPVSASAQGADSRVPTLPMQIAQAGDRDDLTSGFDEEKPKPKPGGADDLTSGFDEGDTKPNAKRADDDLSSGFEEKAEDGEANSAARATSKPESKPTFWNLNGFLRLDGSYNYARKAPPAGQIDHRGLSKLRAAANLQLDLRLGGSWRGRVSGQVFHDFSYGINDQAYPTQVLESREQEAEFREVYLRGSITDYMDLKVGRQTVVWGKSDNIRITDILNPLDFREPGLTDLADLRLPLTMTKLGIFFGSWSLNLVAIHEIRFDKGPVLGSEFYPYNSQPNEKMPEDGGENTEYAASLSAEFSGLDLAFYRARVFDDAPYFAGFEQRHARISMNGLGANLTTGNWVLKVEGAQFTGLRFFLGGGRRFTRYDGLLGVEYAGIGDTTLALEAANRHLAGFFTGLEASPDAPAEDLNQYVFTYRGKFLREKLDLVAVLSYYGRAAEQGSLQRYSATYELAQALKLTGGLVIYTPGDGEIFILKAAQDNDRVFFDLKWSF